jgi:threonine dehydrogenase-like Zn-dependent dehydrogenase
MARSGGTVVEIGVLPGTLTLDPKVWRAKQVDWVNPVLGTLRTGPNADTGDLAVQWVAEGRISVEETVTHELHGLESFEEAVEKTLNKREYGALGPAQIVLD